MNVELIERLWSKTEVKDNHWLWSGALVNGQGIVRYNDDTRVVSRLSLCIYLNLKYKDHSWYANHIDELCRYKHCWNPLHMYIGTIKDNRHDAIKLGTQYKPDRKEFCKNGHEFTEENIYIIYRKEGGIRRNCKMCNYINNKKYREKISADKPKQ